MLCRGLIALRLRMRGDHEPPMILGTERSPLQKRVLLHEESLSLLLSGRFSDAMEALLPVVGEGVPKPVTEWLRGAHLLHMGRGARPRGAGRYDDGARLRNSLEGREVGRPTRKDALARVRGNDAPAQAPERICLGRDQLGGGGVR